jgi:hypothetical protein
MKSRIILCAVGLITALVLSTTIVTVAGAATKTQRVAPTSHVTSAANLRPAHSAAVVSAWHAIKKWRPNTGAFCSSIFDKVVKEQNSGTLTTLLLPKLLKDDEKITNSVPGAALHRVFVAVVLAEAELVGDPNMIKAINDSNHLKKLKLLASHDPRVRAYLKAAKALTSNRTASSVASLVKGCVESSIWSNLY